MLKDVLRESRIELGLKQEDVAKAVDVTKQTYLKWENGTTEPKASQVLALSKVLKISANEICQGKLCTRYTLEEFILQKALRGRSSEIETLKAWENIPDHEVYFNSLKDIDFHNEDVLEVVALEQNLNK